MLSLDRKILGNLMERQCTTGHLGATVAGRRQRMDGGHRCRRKGPLVYIPQVGYEETSRGAAPGSE